MPKRSAGILVYRIRNGKREYLLAHPGGPFWAKKDVGAWSIPKGEYDEGEEPLKAAIREFKEELNIDIKGDFKELKPVRQKSGKIIHAFAVEADLDLSRIKSNTIFIEWPPKSGKQLEIPEVDSCEYFDYETAKIKMIPAQVGLIAEVESTY
ncbi:MAG TPA: NUDIX domain-containing protein [Bacteroidia bacterium]|nr:NUDIX domain-containing protein [Bacteroidia bacterium]